MAISSITKGPRQSNFELLRIVAMFLVLVVHADFMTLGAPTKAEILDSFLPSVTRTVFESLSIVCVNVFILISGWFGIKVSVRGFANFIFQCLFFLLGIYILLLLFCLTQFNIKTLASVLCLYEANWFVLAYIGLYLLSPVLNSFVENTSKEKLRYFLIVFYIFQTIFGWSKAAVFINNGYSVFSFMGLYLLARYLHLYGFKFHTKHGLLIYVTSVIVNTALFLLSSIYGIPIPVYSYVNPIVVVGSVGLLLYFSQINIRYRKSINWIARSAFAAFLLHTNPAIIVAYFQRYVLNIYDTSNGFTCLIYIFAFLLSIYILAILLDQLRQLLWAKLSNRIEC